MLKIGIIGVGSIARNVHIPGIIASDDAVITAICDINPDNLKKIGDDLKLDDAHRFADYNDLISCEDVEAVEICTPNHLHVIIAQEAMKAGKPVNIEKPLSVNYTEASKLETLLKEKNVPNMMCFSYRFRPAVRYAKELIEK